MSNLKIYRNLLRLYPKNYRDQYAEQMTQTLEDMLENEPSRIARARLWLRSSYELPFSIINQNILAIGDNSMHPENYLKRNGLVATALMAPFVAAIVASNINTIIYGNNLQSSWLWATPTILLWAIILPALAFIICLASYIYYAKSAKGSLSKRLLSIGKTWPIIAAGIIGLGIVMFVFFHDSASCLQQDPIRTIHNPSQTYQCIKNRTFGG